MTIQYLTKQQLIEINKYAVMMVKGSNFGVLSESGLDTILESPKQVVFGHELYPTIWLKAAFILQKITKKHIFSDGNKRTSIQASLYFLHLNGYHVREIDLINNAEEFILSITNSPDDEETMIEIARWLEMICTE